MISMHQEKKVPVLPEEAFNLSLMNAIQAYMIIVCPEGRMVGWNSYCEGETGYTLEQIKGKYFWDVLIEKDKREFFRKKFTEENLSHISEQFESCWIPKDGGKKYIKWATSFVHGSDGNIQYVVGTGIDITDKVEFQESLQRSETKFRSLVSSMEDLVFTYNSEGVFSGVFGKWCETNKVPVSDLYGKRINDLNLTEEQKEIQHKAFRKALNGVKAVYQWELAMRNRKGISCFETVLSPIILSDGSINEIVGVTHDITLMKNKEKRLNNLLKENEAILSSTADGVLVIDDQNIITYANDRAINMISGLDDTFIGGTLNQVINGICVSEEDFKTREFPDNTIIEKTCFLKNGRKVYLELVKNSMKEEDRSNGFVISMRDVTFKKKAEEIQKRYYEAISTGIIVQNEKGKIIFSNQNACEILGYPLDHIQTAHPHTKDWDAIDENGMQVKPMEFPYYIAFSTGQPVRKANLGVYNPKKGHYRWLLMDSIPLYRDDDPNQPIECVITTFSDITEQREFNLRMVKAEKLAVIGQLAASVAHEIRNPLTSINGFLTLLRPGLNTREHAYLDIIFEELERINLVTNEFLTLSKPQDRRKEILSIVDDILKPVAITMSPLANLNNVTILWENETKSQIRGVKNQLKQLFINLIKNSIEAMSRGGEIRIELTETADRIVVAIADNGSGIPPERMKHIGEPFYSLKEKGTGLGITICQKIVREHGGDMSVKSELGEGTTVEILLPK